MYAFTYWHAYFDSGFLGVPVRLSDALYQDLEITASHLSRWPPLQPLPELPLLFELLERFILDPATWSGCMCSEGEMDAMQLQLNRLLLLLQCEKKYGLEFWHRSSRRVQASIVHFALSLNALFLALLPQDCRNLLQAQRLQKLTTTMPTLELLVNEILKLVKPIHHFLFRRDFEEEAQLTAQFFQEFNDTLHCLPKVRRSSLARVPRLMEYICVMNPIETGEYEDYDHVRRKNATMFEKPKAHKKHSMEQKDDSRKNFKVVNNSIVKIKDKRSSQDKISFDSPKKRNEFINTFQIFKFRDNVRKYSVYHKHKKQTIASMDTKERISSVDKERVSSVDKERVSSIDKERSPSTSIYHDPVKLKTHTMAAIRAKESSVVQSRSREMTTRSILSRKSRSIKKADDLQAEDVEHEREEKTKKKKAAKLPIKTTRYSQQETLADGRPKGWALIREHIHTKIAQRKLKRLIFE